MWLTTNASEINQHFHCGKVVWNADEFTYMHLWSIQYRAPSWSSPSTDFCHFSILVIKQCWALKPFWKPNWKFEKSWSKDRYISLYIIRLSYTLLKEGRILIGLWFSLSVLLSFLKQVWHWHIFTQWEKWFLIMSYWSCDVWKKQQCSYFLWLL